MEGQGYGPGVESIRQSGCSVPEDIDSPRIRVIVTVGDGVEVRARVRVRVRVGFCSLGFSFTEYIRAASVGIRRDLKRELMLGLG